jgi:hypothetical protein
MSEEIQKLQDKLRLLQIKLAASDKPQDYKQGYSKCINDVREFLRELEGKGEKLQVGEKNTL